MRIHRPLGVSFASMLAASTSAGRNITVDLTSDVSYGGHWFADAVRTEQVGSSMTFNFTGIALAVQLYTFHTYGISTIWLDGVEAAVFDAYRDSAHVGSACALCVSGLTPARHEVKLALTAAGRSTLTNPSRGWLYVKSISYLDVPSTLSVPRSTGQTTGTTSSSTSAISSSGPPAVSTVHGPANRTAVAAVAVGAVAILFVSCGCLVSCLIWFRRRQKHKLHSIPLRYVQGAALDGSDSSVRREGPYTASYPMATGPVSVDPPSSVGSTIREEIRQLRETVQALVARRERRPGKSQSPRM